MVSTSMHHILVLAWHGGIHFYLSIISSTRVSSVRNALRVSSFCPATIAHSCSFRLMTGGLEFSSAWQLKRLSRWNLRSLRTIWAMLIVEFVHPFLAHVEGAELSLRKGGRMGETIKLLKESRLRVASKRRFPSRSFTWSKAHSGVARECLWQHRSFQPLESWTP